MYVPYELIINILSRLPSEALLRFRCVCKSWNSLIKHDSGFHTLHLQNANNSKTNNLAHWLCVHSLSWVRLHSYQVFDKTFTSGKLEPCPEPNHHNEHETRWTCEEVIGSCKGLICVYRRRDHGQKSTKYTFDLWNPSTRTHKTLKVLSTPERFSANNIMIGVGFSNTDNDYKVVVVARNWRRYEQYHHVYLYSLRDNLWSELRVDQPDSSWRNWHISTGHGGTYFNGAFHWTCIINSEGKGKIICFDFDDRSIRRIDLPPKSPDHAFRRTFVHKDRLAYWDRGYGNNNNDLETLEYRFWVMKEYGNSNSWTSLFRIEGDKLPRSNPPLGIFGTTIDGRLLLYRSYNGESEILMAYDPETKESKELQVTYVYTLVSYQESLKLL